ncbi:MAG TPA: Uma2 family endonuclease [Chloroflexota bacterium]|nr:Uma2 family endonuclease [Chloroflexota bacterium]
MAITQQRLTLEEFLKRPERKPALEYEDGVVTQKVAPKSRHSALQGGFLEWINGYARPRHLARAFPELRTTFAGVSRVPDVSVFAWDRIPADAEGNLVDDVFEPPDIAVEIVSPKQGVNGLIRRCLWYVAHGVHLALLVDPTDRSIIAFRPEGRTSALRGADVLDLGDVIPGLRLTVAEIFAALRARD